MGLIGLMNTLKLEGAKYDVKVNTVAPVAGTRLTEDILPPDIFDKVKPEFVTPLVLFLCAEQCPVSGSVYNAGMGYYNRAAIVTGPGAVVGDGTSPPTPEEVASQMAGIKSLKGAVEIPNAVAAFDPMMKAFSRPAEEETESGGGFTVRSIFDNIPNAFRADKASGVDVVFLFDISGPEGGAWSVAVKDGACEVTEGKHESPTTTIKMGDADFVGMIRGELKAMALYTSGKLKIEGDLMKSQLIEKLFKF